MSIGFVESVKNLPPPADSLSYTVVRLNFGNGHIDTVGFLDDACAAALTPGDWASVDTASTRVREVCPTSVRYLPRHPQTEGLCRLAETPDLLAEVKALLSSQGVRAEDLDAQVDYNWVVDSILDLREKYQTAKLPTQLLLQVFPGNLLDQFNDRWLFNRF